MRHLSVPSRQTSEMMEILRERGWLGQRCGVIRLDDEHRGLPLSTDCPQELGLEFNRFKVVEAEPILAPPAHYLDRLKDKVDSETFSDNLDHWPHSHDELGDLIIIKLPEQIRAHSSAIGEALLAQHPKTRLVLQDRGVKGPWRVRDLRRMALREGAEETMRTTVREHGCELLVNPGKVYYSPRLASERAATVETARTLASQLGRPIALADPYAGAGPAVAVLISQTNLVGSLLAADLNPDALEFLQSNIDVSGLDEAHIGCHDALSLADDDTYRNRFDLLLVNLPHESLNHIERILPLLSRQQESVLRGWAIIENENMDQARRGLEQPIITDGREILSSTFEIGRSYSPQHARVTFEVWMQG